VRDEAYLARLHRELPPLLLECEQQGTYDGVPTIDRATGRLLSVLVHGMQANRILEVGTAYGYATLWMALAMPQAGRIWTIDPDMERTRVAAAYFERAGKADAIEIINQPARDYLASFPQRNIDVIFIDADPEEYETYLDSCVPILKRSGLLIIGHLLPDAAARAPKANGAAGLKALPAFHKAFTTHPQLDATIVPIGDGIGIGARID
jgi:caffeoyl-CoA O-methyltransferase